MTPKNSDEFLTLFIVPFPDTEFEKIHGYIHNYNKRETKNLTIKKEDQFENGLVYKLERSGDGKIFYVVSKINWIMI